MGSWVENFDLSSSNSNGLNIGAVRFPQTKKEKLEAELKLLQWHKLANEAAIKAALMKTKELKEQRTNQTLPLHATEDARWMKKVIDEERVKPLEVSRDFVLKYEQKERENAARLSDHVERHINTLKTLRDKIEQRNDTITRSKAYREWKIGFASKKNAVMMGKTLNEISSPSSSANHTMIQPSNELTSGSRNYTDDDIMDRYDQMQYDEARDISNSSKQELSNVLDSLHKLSALEKRITSLESDNANDHLNVANGHEVSDIPIPVGMASSAPAKLQFKKQRVPSSTSSGVVGVVYTLKKSRPANKRTLAWTERVRAKGATATIGRVKPAHRSSTQNDNFDTSNGFFLTQTGSSNHNEVHEKSLLREQIRRDRARQFAQASAGQKALRGRVQERKLRQNEVQLGEQRHREAMSDIARRRLERQTKKIRSSRAAYTGYTNAMASKGASSGVKTNNKYLQDFQQIKQGHQKQKDELRKQQSLRLSMNKSSTITTVNAQSRLTAATSSGTVTRRLVGDLPVRRRMLTGSTKIGAGRAVYNAENDSQLIHGYGHGSTVAVAGIGGLRLLRQQRR